MTNDNRIRGLLLAAALTVLVAGSLVTAAPASAALAGLELVSAESAFNSIGTKSATVPCPRGKVILSGGGFVDGPGGSAVHIDRLKPDPIGHTSFEAAASEWVAGTRSAWRLRVYGICADPPAGLEYVTGQSLPTAEPHRGVLVTCPQGKQVIGLGGAAAVEPNRRVSLSVVIPSVDLTRVVVQSWQELTGEPNNWTAEAYAVCANPIPGAVAVTNSSLQDSSDTRSIGVGCGVKKLHAVGSANFSAGRAWFAGLYPGGSLIDGGAIMTEDPVGFGWDWYGWTVGICA